jgi:uncharacterized tellurite resistance protein B-like protein
MLLDRIRSLLGGGVEGHERSHTEPGGTPDPVDRVDALHVAACALLLDVAHADGEFSDAEQAHLEAVLERHFGLPPESGRRLMELAERERAAAVDQYRFTALLQDSYDVGQKMVLAEIMWGLVLADGEIAEHEHYLTRKISNLLGLAPGYLSEAKSAAARARE